MFGFGLFFFKKTNQPNKNRSVFIIKKYLQKKKKKKKQASSLAHMQQAGRCERSSAARKRIQQDQREKITADRKLPGQAWLKVKCPHVIRRPEKEPQNTSEKLL